MVSLESLIETPDAQKMVIPLENCSTYFLAELMISVIRGARKRDLLEPVEMVQI
jgi:hypothetical protein